MIYLDELLYDYKHPQNRGSLPEATHKGSSSNASCGDKVEIELIVDKGVIRSASFTGDGCVISQVSAERLVNMVVGKSLKEAQNLSEKEAFALLETQINPAREACALVALRALKNISPVVNEGGKDE